MIDCLARNWWAVALRGAIAVAIGVLAFVLPGLTLASLVLLFAVYMLLDGVFAIIAGVRAAAAGTRWWPMVLEGVLDLVAGAIALLWPVATVLAFVYLAAGWAILSGGVLLYGGFRQREFLLGLAGLFSLGWGAFVALIPAGGALALVWLFGAYALVFGIALILVGFRLRGLRAPSTQQGLGREAFAGEKPSRP
jgi:uncharacterized membrane protein HdeD (DUF308 family)